MSESLREFKADLLRSLANPIRIHILEELRAAGSLTVSDLQQRVGVQPSNISQHLGVLRSRAVVAAQRKGTSMHYFVTDPSVFAILDAARALFEGQLERRHESLREPGAE